ncbi:hypothetical protein NI343_004783, partial [Salmonella enterica]|nr:hypothetical protein [Salmonella enterica]EJJ4375447.1 hypothetical protein [Salmonella enterica]EKC2481875.1 hypothetical protein [Salmonella enterica]EKC2992181.1 hypothetical protein [Salmonella enterica]
MIVTTFCPPQSGGATQKSRVPAITTVGYNGRRGDGTLPSQGWTQF